VDAHLLRDHKLGAYSVGGRNQDWVAVVVAECEQASKASDVADHLGAKRGAGAAPDQLDGLLCRAVVDAGV
jgi:hypothetical protein